MSRIETKTKNLLASLGYLSIFTVALLMFSFGMIHISKTLQGIGEERANDWKHFVAENDCSLLESYFGAVERWECKDGEIHWH